jgi:ankyrin repeat protein
MGAERRLEMMALQSAREEKRQVVARLLKNRPEIGTQDYSKDPMLHWAAAKGQEAVVRLLLEEGADIEAKDRYGRTVLHEAARRGQEVLVLLLLEYEVDVDGKSSSEWTPLHMAAHMGHEEVVQLLLEKGTDIETKIPFSLPCRRFQPTLRTNVAYLVLWRAGKPSAGVSSTKNKGFAEGVRLWLKYTNKWLFFSRGSLQGTFSAIICWRVTFSFLL